jgi:hypothetical protein
MHNYYLSIKIKLFKVIKWLQYLHLTLLLINISNISNYPFLLDCIFHLKNAVFCPYIILNKSRQRKIRMLRSSDLDNKNQNVRIIKHLLLFAESSGSLIITFNTEN